MDGGLSPRVRGSRLGSGSSRARSGSIPACTGQPSGVPTSTHGLTVYPRVYGAATVSGKQASQYSGLSPRVRGSLSRAGSVIIAIGSIPACTGQPRDSSRSPGRGWVYPRVYGAACGSRRPDRCRLGLSPRVRGSLVLRVPGSWRERSIPACTGQPSVCCPLPGTSRVYPRVYGAASTDFITLFGLII